MDFNPVDVVVFYISFLFALCFHEWAHGMVAYLRGDDTAKLMGRLTLNPFAHADFFGTLVMPLMGKLMGGFLFGYAKPVPVNPNNLKNPKNDMFLVALAGPMSNLFLAFMAGILYKFMPSFGVDLNAGAYPLKFAFVQFILLNLFLAVFNMLPLHPLDGGKILERFIPAKWNDFLEEYQMHLFIALMGLIFLGPGRILFAPVYILLNIIMSL